MPMTIRIGRTKRLAKGGFETQLTDLDDLEEPLEFGSRREAREALRLLLDDNAVKDLLKAIVIARGLRIGQDGDSADDLDALEGKSIIFNLRAAQNIVRIV